MPPPLEIDADLFHSLVTELALRGKGQRESGAFLLSDAADIDQLTRRRVTAIAYYDDLDSSCLTGGITFGADGYTALGRRCRTEHRTVIADIHTHPSGGVGQSSIDATHPMVAIPGHVAFIAPNYAQGVLTPENLGAHEFLGNGKWKSNYGTDVNVYLAVASTNALAGRRGVARVVTQVRSALRRFLTRRPPR